MISSSRLWTHWGQGLFQHTDHPGVWPPIVAQWIPCEKRWWVLEMEWIYTARGRRGTEPGAGRGGRHWSVAYWNHVAGWVSNQKYYAYNEKRQPLIHIFLSTLNAPAPYIPSSQSASPSSSGCDMVAGWLCLIVGNTAQLALLPAMGQVEGSQ